MHTSLLHAALNVWCLWVLVFYYGIGSLRIALAYIIAVCEPSLLLPSEPTIGLSGVCFALLGMNTFHVKRKLYWSKWMFFYLVVGFFLPCVSGGVHLWCFSIGLCCEWLVNVCGKR